MKTNRVFGCITAVFALILLSGPTMAQQERDVIELIKTQISGQRQALVAENMMLTAEESEVFWPLYREYQGQRNTMSDRRIALLRKFRDNFDGMNDEQSSEILDDWMKFEEDIQQLRKKYIKKFEKAVGGRTSLRFFQLENKLDTIIDYDLAQVVPLAQ
jgi:hypothetical protein